MKKVCTACILTLCLLITACRPINWSQVETTSPFTYSWNDRSLFEEGLTHAYTSILGELPGATTYHISLTIDSEIIHISGIEDIQYTNRSNSSDISQLELRLYANILGGACDVSNVEINGEETTPQFSMENSLMIIPLSTPLQPGESVTIHVEFSDIVPTIMETNYGILVYYDEILALAHFYPMMAVFENGSWQAEIPPKQGDILFNETSFYIVSVTAPSDLVVVGSGREIEKVKSGKFQHVQYAAGPARDFFLAASPNFTKLSQDWGETTINSYAPNSLRAGSQLALDTAAASLQEFSDKFAPYPYTELNIVAIPTLAYGIEYPGMIAMNQDLYNLSETTNGVPMSAILESSTVHEAVHQWFYNMVGNDQVNDPWLDESLAQYATWQYYVDLYGENAAQGFESSLESRWQRVNHEDIPIGLPVDDYQDKEYSAIIYGRGAFFFEALDQMMGTEKFDTFLHDYTSTNAWKIVTTEEFKSLAENECGCNLTPLFDAWVYPSQ